MLFRSQYPDIEYPTDLTVWEWAFEDARHSPLFRFPPNEVAGFTNAATQERLDFFQVKEHSTQLCTALVKRYGLQETDTVSLFSQNTIWYPVAMYAVLRAGGKVNGASPAYSVDEMTHALKTADAKYIMTVPNSIKVALAAAKEAGIPKERIFLLEGEVEGYTTMKQLLEIGKSYGNDGQTPIYRIPKGRTNDVCGFLTFSSGTTGLPKAVMLSHKNMIAQCQQLKDVAGSDKKRFLASLPLFHISGLVRFVNWPIASNDECIMLPHFTMTAFLDAIVKYKITDLTLVPSIVIRLVRDPIVNNYDITSVKLIACGAAPLGQEILQELEKKMPWTGFRQSYGMTESCCCLTTHPPEFYSYKYANSGGMLLGSTTVKVTDVSTGRELGPNETGELLAKGPQIAMGYLANAKETAETFGADGFLRTGDIGSIDDQGFIHIVDRIKEMIKVKGQQVAPAELEHLLLSHPDVEDCAVLGVPDEYSVERPKAYIVLKPGVEPSDALGKALIQYVKERRVRYKWLKEIEYIAEIPKSPSSKILRRELREKEKRGKGGFVVRDASERPRL
ncbi:4-coumarate-CoA ligase 2 [Lepidopterella palustris CBS 459.81]|uniref:4-coumarate-CoA ligase 2 n=1 Tax=Lepidopterella palustris CBS 459.81 TaxID=1314670 RepID=A0A8E2J8T6_9PEZI|nr:4-coumarate-CoA ligase 2 [Lepidopterella palustris CBS 459.81]